MMLFSLATLGLVFMLFCATIVGGLWAFGALIYVTIFTFSIDELAASGLKNGDPDGEDGVEFPASLLLSTILGVLHFVLLLLTIWAVAGASGFGIVERVVTFVAAGLFFGQVSHPNAHELIHRNTRKFSRIGRLVYGSLLIGHHTSAHRLVHHTYVGTDKDPVSAPLGLGFYHFASIAVVGSFREGLRAETKRLKNSTKKRWHHPYIGYFLVALSTLTVAYIMAGFSGFFVLVGLAGYTQIQMFLSDYVQHYGLRRDVLADGHLEPIGPMHSWNSPHVFSSALMLNAPRHSDHHMHPARPYPALQLDIQNMPMLPYSLPVMAVIALWPNKWRFIMDPLCADLKGDWPLMDTFEASKFAPETSSDVLSTGVSPPEVPHSSNDNTVQDDPDVAAVRDLIARANADDGRGI